MGCDFRERRWPLWLQKRMQPVSTSAAIWAGGTHHDGDRRNGSLQLVVGRVNRPMVRGGPLESAAVHRITGRACAVRHQRWVNSRRLFRGAPDHIGA